MGRLEGKIALITGAGQGIGRAAARLFATEGARVVVAEIAREQGEATAKTIRDAGGEVLFVATDVRDPASASKPRSAPRSTASAGSMFSTTMPAAPRPGTAR
jgi:NAD(P)-dependent dehydrogenase (short-subunit alcohol dehydrogenase family)